MSNGPLTQQQLDTFHREGWLVVDDVFTDADLQPVIDEITAEIDTRAKQAVDEGVLSDAFVDEPFDTRLMRIHEQTPNVTNGIWSGTLAGPQFFNLICHPNLLAIAEQFCGPEVIASSVYRLRPKLPHHPRGAVPWHQDAGYTEPYCDSALMLTVWLPLVDAHEDNGCLWVVPRVHRQGIVEHLAPPQSYLVIKDDEVDFDAAVPAPVKKGGILLLTNMTPHASFDNNSDHVRWSMDLRYQSATLPTNAPITRLEGDITPGGDDDAPVACYPPEADFLVRSEARPNEVVTDPAVFYRIRKEHMGKPVTRRWKTLETST